MWYVCGCNLGCSKIAIPPAELKDGLPVQVISGVEKGEKGFVVQSKDKSGADVFGISPHNPGSLHICATAPDPHFLGYVCETSKAGELNGHACDSECN